MVNTRSKTSGKTPKSYVTKKAESELSHAHHLAAAERRAQSKELLEDPKFKGINLSKIRKMITARSGLDAVRALRRLKGKSGGTRRSKSRGRKYTMRW